MANHAEDLGRTLLEQRGSLTADICKKAVEEAAARIEKDAALKGVQGLINDLRVYLMRNQSDVEKCLAEIRRVLLRSSEIMRQKSDAPTNPTPKNGNAAKATEEDSRSGSVPSGKSTR